MATQPHVTIGVPVYNGERYLAGALDALLAQDYDRFVVVISDNASTDASPEIGREYARRDERISFVANSTNIGGAANFSKLARAATTPLFKWAAVDDLVAPSFLSRCVQTLEENPDAVVAYPQTVMIDEEGRTLRASKHRLNITDPDPAARIRQLTLSYVISNAAHGVMRTGPLQQTSLIQPKVSSDITLLAELALRGAIIEIPEPLFFRRVVATSVGLGGLSRRQIQDWYRPNGRLELIPPMVRVSWDIQRSISRAPLSARDKARCHVSYRAARAQHFVRMRRTGLSKRKERMLARLR